MTDGPSRGAVAKCNALSLDVEDYFQVSAFEPNVDRDDWSHYEVRLERNVYAILEMLDAAQARCTFFFLGWVAEKFPQLVRAAVDQGHEIASHGYQHTRVTNQSAEAFRQDVMRTKKILEDTSGIAVRGYRAASFSISADNDWAHRVLADTGHEYSSSLNPIRHDRYGMREFPRFPFRRHDDGVVELPVATVEFGSWRLPCGGGGYFRLLPYWISRACLRRVNRRDGQAAIFYFHPWEIDPGQPRISGANRKSKFRHYVNLDRMQGKLERLFNDFRWDTVAATYADEIAAPGATN